MAFATYDDATQQEIADFIYEQVELFAADPNGDYGAFENAILSKYPGIEFKAYDHREQKKFEREESTYSRHGYWCLEDPTWEGTDGMGFFAIPGPGATPVRSRRRENEEEVDDQETEGALFTESTRRSVLRESTAMLIKVLQEAAATRDITPEEVTRLAKAWKLLGEPVSKAIEMLADHFRGGDSPEAQTAVFEVYNTQPEGSYDPPAVHQPSFAGFQEKTTMKSMKETAPTLKAAPGNGKPHDPKSGTTAGMEAAASKVLHKAPAGGGNAAQADAADEAYMRESSERHTAQDVRDILASHPRGARFLKQNIDLEIEEILSLPRDEDAFVDEVFRMFNLDGGEGGVEWPDEPKSTKPKSTQYGLRGGVDVRTGRRPEDYYDESKGKSLSRRLKEAAHPITDTVAFAVALLVDEEGWSENDAFNAITDLGAPGQIESWLKENGGDVTATARFIVGTVTMDDADFARGEMDLEAKAMQALEDTDLEEDDPDVMAKVTDPDADGDFEDEVDEGMASAALEAAAQKLISMGVDSDEAYNTLTDIFDPDRVLDMIAEAGDDIDAVAELMVNEAQDYIEPPSNDEEEDEDDFDFDDDEDRQDGEDGEDEESEERYDEAVGLFMSGGSVGDKKDGPTLHKNGKHYSLIQKYDDPAEAKDTAKRRNAQRSPGEKGYYGIHYTTGPLKEGYLGDLDASPINYLNVNIGIPIGPEYHDDPQSDPQFIELEGRANDAADYVETEYFEASSPSDNGTYNINCGFRNAQAGYDFAEAVKAEGYYVETESFTDDDDKDGLDTEHPENPANAGFFESLGAEKTMHRNDRSFPSDAKANAATAKSSAIAKKSASRQTLEAFPGNISNADAPKAMQMYIDILKQSPDPRNQEEARGAEAFMNSPKGRRGQDVTFYLWNKDNARAGHKVL